METVSFAEADVPHELRVHQVAIQNAAWPSADGETGPWHDPVLRPRCVLLIHDGRVVATADILSKHIVHDGEAFEASGLSAVVTDPAHRGRGYGHEVVVAARLEIERSGADLGIFTCDPPLLGFYERAGWRHLPGTVVIGGTPDDPFPSDALDKVTLGGFFSPLALAQEQRFVRARIELYPGAIDRLW